MHDDDETPEDSLIRAVARIPPRPVDRTWTPPTELDEYRLLRPLGHGGMGSVWLAQDRLLDRLVAVKFIAHAEPDPATRERFAIEARAAARLSHVNVVTVHRFGEIAGRPYLVSEYIRGDSLDQLAKPVAWERCLELGIELARGLAAAHRHGIVHRDIKPGNAILTADGHAKLVDFGLARLAAGELAAGGAAAIDSDAATDPAGAIDGGGVTRPGAIAGTPRYLAPEVRGGEPATRASDVYQLGCILYELAIGRAPIFDLPGEPHDAEVPSLIERMPGAAVRLAAVIDRCLRRDPAQRFESGDQLREALERTAAVAPGGELPEGNPYRGLLGFDAEHRALFFGRGADIRAVIERLRADAFVVVAGDSGVGKSSLCRAGVLPHMVHGALGDGRAWRALAIVPGRRPLTALAHAAAAELELDAGALAEVLRTEPVRLARELRRVHGPARGAVIFVDQLEELVTLADPAELRAFSAVLGQLALATPGIRLLATVRSDYLARVAEIPAIGGELARSLYLLRPLTLDGAREAIVGPARAKGARFESDALVDTLVASVAGPDGDLVRSAIELPLLAFTLAELWDARDVPSQTISARSLAAIGGVRGALASHADRVIDGLVPAQRAAARKLLLRLVTPERTRVRRTADELAGLDRGALDALVRARLVVARGGGEPSFELAHERLIDGWPTLAGWLSGTAEAAAARARLAAAVAEWQRAARGKDLLWSERRLADLAPIADDDLAPDEAEFVAASRRAVRRRRVLRRGIAIAIPIALASLYVAARVVARRDIDEHIAGNVGEADRALVVARAASAAAGSLAHEAYARFDAGHDALGEPVWTQALALGGEAQQAYAEAARGLEAAFLLDTGRDDVGHRLAELSYERLQLADRDHRPADRAEIAARLPLYDRDGEFRAKLTAPASLSFAIQPDGAQVAIESAAVSGSTAASQPLTAAVNRVAPGSYVLVARASGRAEVRLPLVLGPGDERRVSLVLPAERDVPAGWIYVPGGRFLSGSRDDEAIRQFFSAAPMHEVDTAAYLIARTEVTYQQWIEFLDALAPTERALRTPHVDNPPRAEPGTIVRLRRVAGSWELFMQPTTVEYTARAGSPLVYADRARRKVQDWLQFPVSGISPEDAEAYAAWLDRSGRVPHARLCRELEWERAARGADGRSYPAGEQLAPDDANVDVTYGQRDEGFGPDAVGAHPLSTSVFGLADTAGNVWEITRANSGRGFTLRGGCFFMSVSTAHLANRQGITPTYRHLHAGIRMCADPP